ncbi:MAG: hypothetical protein JWL90_663 [Chthoniobacteraceae bacterium]|nr:hypothetical protein [Chthoniobacteraceae bacterium]
MKRFFKRKRIWLAVAATCLLALASVYFFQPEKEVDSLNVPLGVEQAAIVTYSGPPVAVTPYKWGVAVNVRIARVTEQAGSRVYDVRYIANRAGTFDLKDYLASEDGRQLDGLPSFKFQGDPKLSKELDARIQETEKVHVDVGGHYYATLAGLAVFWIVWLLLLLFYGRPKRPKPAPDAPSEPTLAELLRSLLLQLEAGTLDADGKASMEMLILRHWREELALGGIPMNAALDAIKNDGKTGSLLRQLQDWLHRPGSTVGREDIAAFMAPYTIEAQKPAATQP